ncbi:hypothetical protein [Bacillus atrophaeus]|uniref:hypothetical protein n=1 Tax=Bacillus atrophaeus TaxID=1452 RepID=UPI002280CD42|nr:hypothetical protein [Bacillus atrophaeus]MCY8944295.1 hypothetical protein [Bacillus atrophaeus]MED4842789.1 hypothetical protein [Bacillus atrophaeus]MED4861368.1 hypothetical protein [Bacillus atrophaeus]
MLFAIDFSTKYTPNLQHLIFAITMSMVGAIIGHLKSNGSIQMPLLLIDYKRKKDHRNVKIFKNPLKFLRICFDFLLFLIGIRHGMNKNSNSLSLELGVFGDLIVGIATGSLSFAALGLSGANNTFTLITTSMLAGFGGFSYIENMQIKNMNKQEGYDYQATSLDSSSISQFESHKETAASQQFKQ